MVGWISTNASLLSPICWLFCINFGNSSKFTFAFLLYFISTHERTKYLSTTALHSKKKQCPIQLKKTNLNMHIESFSVMLLKSACKAMLEDLSSKLSYCQIQVGVFPLFFCLSFAAMDEMIHTYIWVIVQLALM